MRELQRRDMETRAKRTAFELETMRLLGLLHDPWAYFRRRGLGFRLIVISAKNPERVLHDSPLHGACLVLLAALHRVMHIADAHMIASARHTVPFRTPRLPANLTMKERKALERAFTEFKMSVRLGRRWVKCPTCEGFFPRYGHTIQCWYCRREGRPWTRSRARKVQPPRRLYRRSGGPRLIRLTSVPTIDPRYELRKSERRLRDRVKAHAKALHEVVLQARRLRAQLKRSGVPLRDRLRKVEEFAVKRFAQVERAYRPRVVGRTSDGLVVEFPYRPRIEGIGHI